MKRLILALTLVAAAISTRGDNVSCKRIIDVGATKVVPFEETLSPDGKFAIGWTAFTKSKDAKPIDWAKWNSDNIEEFFVSEGSIDTDDKFYGMTDCIIDLKSRTFLALPWDEPEFPHKNHGHLVAAWGPITTDLRYALVQNDSRFSTENLWLIKIDSEGLHQRDIADALNKALEPILRSKRPVGSSQYETFFSLDDSGSISSKPIVFHDAKATFSFTSDVPKSLVAASAVDGEITIRLADGGVVKIISNTAVDDPFASNAELAKADAELNAVYSKLAKSLSSSDRMALKKDQLNWINRRDEMALEALDPTDDRLHGPLAGRNEELLKDTKDRITEFQKRMK